MNHVLRYTQLKFKLDPLIKPEILGSIPSGVANLWTRIFHARPHSIGETRFLFEKKENEKKLVFSSFKKPTPGEERCCLESPLTFYFVFKMGKIK